MLQISQYPNFLAPHECKQIIDAASERITEAGVVGSNEGGYRTAESCWLPTNEAEVLQSVRERVAELTGKTVNHLELNHVVKYSVGGKYDKHFDWFDPNIEEHKEHLQGYGNRTHSFLIYLNDDFSGGDTYFDVVDVNISPKKGKGLLWNNTSGSKRLQESSHAGVPVTEGCKWILIIWIRENNEYIPPHIL